MYKSTTFDFLRDMLSLFNGGYAALYDRVGWIKRFFGEYERTNPHTAAVIKGLE